MDVAGVNLVDHLGCHVAQHPLCAHVEQLDDAFFVRRNNGKIFTRKNSVSQCARFEQRLLAFNFYAVGFRNVIENAGAVNLRNDRFL